MSVLARKVRITVKAAKTSRTAALVRIDVLRATQIGKRTDHQTMLIEKTVSQQRSAKLPHTTRTVRREPVRWIAALEIFAMLAQTTGQCCHSTTGQRHHPQRVRCSDHFT